MPEHQAEIGQSSRTDAPMSKRGAATRAKLLAATVKMLENKPFVHITIAEIARLADVSHTAFYRYFSSVTDAILAACQDVSQSPPHLLELFASDWSRATAAEQVRTFLRAYLRLWDENRSLLRARNLATEEGNLRFLEVREAALVPLLNAISRHIKQAQAEGRLDRGLDPVAHAGAIIAMVERLGQVGHLYDSAPEIPSRAQADGTTYVVLNALGWREAT